MESDAVRAAKAAADKARLLWEVVWNNARAANPGAWDPEIWNKETWKAAKEEAMQASIAAMEAARAAAAAKERETTP